MLEILFMIGTIWIFGKLFFFGIQAAWGLSKLVMGVIFLPIVLILMVIGGLLYLALPILIIAGILSFVLSRR